MSMPRNAVHAATLVAMLVPAMVAADYEHSPEKGEEAPHGEESGEAETTDGEARHGKAERGKDEAPASKQAKPRAVQEAEGREAIPRAEDPPGTSPEELAKVAQEGKPKPQALQQPSSRDAPERNPAVPGSLQRVQVVGGAKQAPEADGKEAPVAAVVVPPQPAETIRPNADVEPSRPETAGERNLRTSIAERLAERSDLSLGAKLVSIDIEGQKVVLRGTVRTLRESRTVEQVARETEGVQDVRNDLRPRNQLTDSDSQRAP